MMKKPVIEFRKVCKSFEAPGGVRRPVRDFDLTVFEGEWVTLLGPSGCGKSTLLQLASSLLEPDKGEIIRDSDACARLGYLFQEPALLPWLTVLRNVELPRLGENGGAIRSDPVECLRSVGLQGCEGLMPHQLSGGMKARVGLAQILFARPSVFLLDEPFSALDDFNRLHLMEELLRVRDVLNATCIFVTHNVLDAVYLSDRVVLLGNRENRPSVESVLPVALPKPRTKELRRTEKCIRLVQDIQDAAASFLEF